MGVPLIKLRDLADFHVNVSMFYEVIFIKPTVVHSESIERPKMAKTANGFQLLFFAKKELHHRSLTGV